MQLQSLAEKCATVKSARATSTELRQERNTTICIWPSVERLDADRHVAIWGRFLAVTIEDRSPACDNVLSDESRF